MAKITLPWTEKLSLTPDEVAAITGVSRSSIYNMLNEGKLPFVEMNGRRLVLRETLVRWMREQERVGRGASVSLEARPYARRRKG